MSASLRAAAALALMALWSGGALLVATTVAPAAFEVLPSRALAGSLVGRVLPVVFVAGMIAGVVAAALVWRKAVWRGAAAAAAAVAAACAVAHFVIGTRIARLREAIGPSLDALDPADPRRVDFGRLHGISVGVMGIAVLAALVFIILSLRATAQPFQES